MGIIFSSFWQTRHSMRCHPHKKLTRLFRSHVFYQLMGKFIHIHKRNVQLFSHTTR
ncbi:hypothetical protein EVA_08971 [gut metagenome]|uniref:Uncharacterized protein n=1 Tax=gut metagenome TaxID=749906 RepID=J9CRU9_9ZZZZ